MSEKYAGLNDVGEFEVLRVERSNKRKLRSFSRLIREFSKRVFVLVMVSARRGRSEFGAHPPVLQQVVLRTTRQQAIQKCLMEITWTISTMGNYTMVMGTIVITMGQSWCTSDCSFFL